jgi:hypothetical protein
MIKKACLYRIHELKVKIHEIQSSSRHFRIVSDLAFVCLHTEQLHEPFDIVNTLMLLHVVNIALRQNHSLTVLLYTCSL